MLTSLDPRITRLHLPDAPPSIEPKEAFDQFETYEAFHQKKDGTAFTYVGPVHAPTADVAFLFAKEQYSRRFPCTGMWVAPTRAISLTRYVGDTESVYDFVTEQLPAQAGPEPDESVQQAEAYARGEEDYAIFHLKKRGKAHVHAGMVRAASPEEALLQAKAVFGEQRPVVNVWVVRWADVLTSDEDDRDIWSTTPEKKYRDAIAYKVQDRIDRFKLEGNK
ncbi:phenylacetic acid degradation b [Hymenobacter oligotrophus]|uniref:Phenylacetic acid degradation b n=1 Tax=Hymenobacter oligotrophus TaxID=2319843 RepID=A0A3B7R8F7_9BACT|nr:phenylacetic acid degradation b [Hymenobacter oligotrophus]AYA35956.1 phenylacetic acid degradation b [Hymenobacter oligotrophus]